MLTLEALETAVTDYKRSQALFDDLKAKRLALLAQLDGIQAQMETAKTSAAANEEALKGVALLFSKGGK